MAVLYLRRGDITTNNRVDRYRSIRGVIAKVYQKYLIYISYYEDDGLGKGRWVDLANVRECPSPSKAA